MNKEAKNIGVSLEMYNEKESMCKSWKGNYKNEKAK